MIERKITIEDVEPVDILGVDNKTLKELKERFPKVKIIARGRTIKFSGEQQDVELFEEKISLMINYLKKYSFKNSKSNWWI